MQISEATKHLQELTECIETKEGVVAALVLATTRGIDTLQDFDGILAAVAKGFHSMEAFRKAIQEAVELAERQNEVVFPSQNARDGTNNRRNFDDDGGTGVSGGGISCA